MNRTDPKICALCAAQGPSCCALSPGDEQFCFPLGSADRAAIMAAGYTDTGMVEVTNTRDFVDQLANLLPDHNVPTVFAPGGRHWRLAVSPRGQCVFLGAAGCLLDQSSRPGYCRLFPFWIYEGRLTWFVSEDCLAARTHTSAASMLRCLDMDAARVRALFTELCTDLGLVER